MRHVFALIVVTYLLISACDRDRSRDVHEPVTAAPASPATTSASTLEATAAATPTPAPTVVAGGAPVPVTPLQYGDEIDLPPDIALIVETGCFQCDGPPTGLTRVYRDHAGALRTDVLIERTEGESRKPYISTLAVGRDDAEMVVGLCIGGNCGPVGQPTLGAVTVLYRSTDGGVTWAEFGRLDGAYDIEAVDRGQILLAGPFEPGAQTPAPLRLYPAGGTVAPPAQAAGGRPVALPGGELVWMTADRRQLLRDDGSTLISLNLNDGGMYGVLSNAAGDRLVVHWYDGRNYYTGVLGRDGRPQRVYSLGANKFVLIGAWPAPSLAFGNISVTAAQLKTLVPQGFVEYLPALVDLDTGRVSPLPRPFLDPPLRNGRNHVRAAVRGPFARVSGAGDCLNVRVRPAAAASVLMCAADGVLLRDGGETREADGARWLRVTTPDGREGWASMQYLER